VLDAVALGSQAQARHPDGTGPWRFPSALSPGQTNQVRLHREVVLNEIFYHPPDGSVSGSWMELLNRSTSDVDLSGWNFAEGIGFRFPAGTTLKAGQLLLVAENPGLLRSENPGIQVVGPFEGKLSNSGERLVLVDAAGNPADLVEYADSGRWPEEAEAA
jgi:hypothetical protein